MPTYTYQCLECSHVFDQFHSMSETVEACEKCDAKVKRLLSKPLNIKKSTNFGKKKPGSVVKQYIKDVKEEIKAEKRRIKSTEYEAE